MTRPVHDTSSGQPLSIDFVSAPKSSSAALILGAIGVVYGDIGTSVLYAVKEVFGHGHVPLHGRERLRHPVDVLLDADGHRLAQVRGAGAARRQRGRGRPGRHAGAGLAGRGSTSPAAPACCWWSASSAPRSSTATASSRRRSRCCRRSRAWRWCRRTFRHYVIPITLVVLFCLFAVQKRGTAGIGRFFGPITLVWFAGDRAAGRVADRAATRRS